MKSSPHWAQVGWAKSGALATQVSTVKSLSNTAISIPSFSAATRALPRFVGARSFRVLSRSSLSTHRWGVGRAGGIKITRTRRGRAQEKMLALQSWTEQDLEIGRASCRERGEIWGV